MIVPKGFTRPTIFERSALALVFGLCVATFAYAAVRIIDVVLFPEPNPVVVIWTDRSRFVWRAVIATYLGGAGVFGGYRLSRETSERTPVWLARIILLAGATLLFQTIFAP